MPALPIEIRAVITEARWPKPPSEWFFGKARVVDESNGRPGVIKITGNASPDDLQLQTEYLLYGEWTEHPEHGRQFKLSHVTRTVPHSRTGVVKYLQQAPHIGFATAAELWEKFGSDAVKTVRERPDVAAAAISGGWFSLDKAKEASAKLQKLVELENCTIKLHTMLDGHGFRKSLPDALIRKFGGRAPEVIGRDPYKLRQFPGVGFPKADKLYQELGLPAARLKRQAICALHEIEQDRDGNTWLPVERAIAGIKKHVGGTEVNPAKALQLARRAKLIAVRMGDDDCRNCEGGPGNLNCPFCKGTKRCMWVAEYRKAAEEQELAELIAAASLESSRWPAILQAGKAMGFFDLCTPHQMAEIEKSLGGGPIASLTGGPGCGKTFLAAPVIRTIVETCGLEGICVCAPTGKASVRQNESMEEHQLGVSATTEHRMLHVASVDENGFHFHYRKGNPLPVQFILADEQSMKDVPLMLSLFRARGRGTHILFVGDIDQLPPIGHGAPFRDMLASDLPSSRLTEPHRNAGTIVHACAAIREGRAFPTDDQLAVGAIPPKNLKFINSVTAMTPRFMIDTLRKVKAGGNSDPIWDCQVICAVNVEGSKLSRGKLNKLLQQELNPDGKAVPGGEYRVGDKVTFLKNRFVKMLPPEEAVDTRAGEQPEGVIPDDLSVVDENQKVLICNGDFGRVTGFDDKHLHVEFTTPTRLVALPFAWPKSKAKSVAGGKGSGGHKSAAVPAGDGEELESEAGGESESTESAADKNADRGGSVSDLTLGYACTCHKMQGSQSKIVIVLLDDYPGATGRFGVCKREWLYTAISRAQKACFLIGKMSTALAMISEQSLPNRKTFLRELIQEHRKKLIGPVSPVHLSNGAVGEANGIGATNGNESQRIAFGSGPRDRTSGALGMSRETVWEVGQGV